MLFVGLAFGNYGYELSPTVQTLGFVASDRYRSPSVRSTLKNCGPAWSPTDKMKSMS